MLIDALYLHPINELKLKMTKMTKFEVFYRFYVHKFGYFVSFDSIDSKLLYAGSSELFKKIAPSDCIFLGILKF